MIAICKMYETATHKMQKWTKWNRAISGKLFCVNDFFHATITPKNVDQLPLSQVCLTRNSMIDKAKHSAVAFFLETWVYYPLSSHFFKRYLHCLRAWGYTHPPMKRCSHTVDEKMLNCHKHFTVPTCKTHETPRQHHKGSGCERPTHDSIPVQAHFTHIE